MTKITVVMLAVVAAVFFILTLFSPRYSSFATERVSPAADTAIDWKKMNHYQRKDYMKKVVMPRMRAAFASLDSDRYDDIKCKTCHGMGVENESFKMPNPELPKLPKTREAFMDLGKKNPRMMRFMIDSVKPLMMSLLNLKPFDPKSGKGFGCGNCHTSQE